MKLLIDRGCDVNAMNFDVLPARSIAVLNNRPEALKFLKERNDWKKITQPFELASAMSSNHLELFKILLKDEKVPLYLLSQLVSENRYEMLSYVLLECSEIPALSVGHLQELIEETTNEDIIKLLEVKIELMTTKIKDEFKVKEEAVDDQDDDGKLLGGNKVEEKQGGKKKASQKKKKK